MNDKHLGLKKREVLVSRQGINIGKIYAFMKNIRAEIRHIVKN